MKDTLSVNLFESRAIGDFIVKLSTPTNDIMMGILLQRLQNDWQFRFAQSRYTPEHIAFPAPKESQ